jgi:sec-independent protein translocase protein TatB
MPGFQEILVILVVAALVLGPNRLPKVAADAARLLARFRREAQSAMSELKKQADVEGLGTELRVLRNEMKDTTGIAKRAVRAELRALTEQPDIPTTSVGPTDVARTEGVAGSDDPISPTKDTA